MAYEGFRQIFGSHILKKVKKVDGLGYLPDPPFIVAANHNGFLDAMAITLYVQRRYHQPLYYITTPWAWKMFGKYLARHWLNMIPRQDDNKQETFEETLRCLRSGHILGIFPEGTRNPDPQVLLRGKTGAVRFALATGVPLIPVGIYNTTGHYFTEAFKSLWQPAKEIRLTFGAPIDLSEYKNKPIDKPLLEAATRRLMLSIGLLCGKKYPF
jgi:1-acyl-sn-glycerol-3-phosphate acyltransferase